MTECPNCGTEILDGCVTCPKCTINLKDAERILGRSFYVSPSSSIVANPPPTCIYCESPIDTQNGYCTDCQKTLSPGEIVEIKTVTDQNEQFGGEPTDPGQSTIHCPHCGFESNGRNSLCPSCTQNMLLPDVKPVSNATPPSPAYTIPPTVGGGSQTIQKKPSWTRTLIFLLIIGGIVWAFTGGPLSANAHLQSQMDQVLQNDSRNAAVHMNAYYSDSDVIVLDLQAVTGTGTRLDVFRVVLQFAEWMRAEDFRRVEFAYKGKTRFFIEGSYFTQLGNEYSYQNAIYTIRTFPSNVYNPDGSHAYSTWTGGILGVLKEETEDFIDFHDRWYCNAMQIEQT